MRLHRPQFWSQKAVNLLLALILVLGVLSIWFDDPTRLATAFGLLSAGLAFALQKVITATAGCFLIQGKNLQCRRPHCDGRRAGRRDRPQLHADYHTGDGPAAS